MTDLTPALNELLSSKDAPSIPGETTRRSPTETTDEFLKEAYRINSHIHSLLTYLHTIRPSYLSTTAAPQRRQPSKTRPSTTSPTSPPTPPTPQTTLTDPERDEIDSSTSTLLRDLAASITNLSSAESLRQETEATLLRKKYGHSAAGAALWRWAGGGTDDSSPWGGGKSEEQVAAEEGARTVKTVREGVLWFLRTGLEGAASVQRSMVEKRIERVREREKSVLYKSAGGARPRGGGVAAGAADGRPDSYPAAPPTLPTPDAAVLSEADSAQIESQLSPEQLQLFAEENDVMLRYYEDTLGKVQNAEKSLLEISSLQETLVTHLATQEEHISQLVSDVDSTETNVGRGNTELKRATERRSTAQAVFWGTVGLCTWLVVWDLVF